MFCFCLSATILLKIETKQRREKSDINFHQIVVFWNIYVKSNYNFWRRLRNWFDYIEHDDWVSRRKYWGATKTTTPTWNEDTYSFEMLYKYYAQTWVLIFRWDLSHLNLAIKHIVITSRYSTKSSISIVTYKRFTLKKIPRTQLCSERKLHFLNTLPSHFFVFFVFDICGSLNALVTSG